MKDTAKNKLNKYISRESLDWMAQADYYEINKDWLNKSALIAIKILSTLRSQSITQKALADSMGVTPQYINKVVKGYENLSLETICKIERSLGISLISVPSYESSQVILDSFSTVPFSIPKIESKPIGSKKTEYNSESKYQPQEIHIAA
ncbi:MAG TPA: helix-turn-helix transcriptional regulator [Bacteroidales bacterium]|jgi:transcriptional regulator with XRE-family HTH domain|nr:helix-turn-helix transcriptional regulator [Bacteroidales bacterium]HQH25678.1 helix-turn-helix transcriptional regulator [Bacteroidales bacterium]